MRKIDSAILASEHIKIIDSSLKELKDGVFDFKESIQLIMGDTKKSVILTSGQFLYNVIMLKPYFIFGYDIEKEDILLSYSQKSYQDTINKYIRIFKDEDDVDLKDLKDVILEMNNNISDVSGVVNHVIGNTIDLFSIVTLMRKNKNLRALMHYKIDEKEEISSAERKLSEAIDKMIDIFKTNDSCLRPFLQADVGIKHKQLRETLLSVGYKPNLRGDIIEKPINSSFIRGLTNAEDYANNAIGSRKSLIITFRNVKRAGLSYAR